jgi:membrane protease YdiL (CAAX protease family)
VTGQSRAERASQDIVDADLRGFGPLGVLAMVVILVAGNVRVAPMVFVPVGAILVLLWARLSRTPWRDLGYVRPRNWAATLAGGVAFGCAFKLLMKAIVMPLLGADPVNQTYHFLAGNTAMLPLAVLAMFNAGFAEETVFRGYIFERLGRLLGRGAGATTAIVLLTSILFGLGHYADQGRTGVEQATIVGLIFGTAFAITRRIWMLICAHVAFDLTALAVIYLDLESDVAHLIWK